MAMIRSAALCFLLLLAMGAFFGGDAAQAEGSVYGDGQGFIVNVLLEEGVVELEGGRRLHMSDRTRLIDRNDRAITLAQLQDKVGDWAVCEVREGRGVTMLMELRLIEAPE